MTRQKPLKVTDILGLAAINRRPLRKAIQSVNRSKKASRKIRGMANRRRRGS